MSRFYGSLCRSNLREITSKYYTPVVSECYVLRLAGDPVEIGMEIAIASFDSISEVNMVSHDGQYTLCFIKMIPLNILY